MMINEIFRICAITALLIVVLLLLKVSKGNKNAIFAIAFIVAVISYLIVDWKGEIHHTIFLILLIGPFLLPVLFWLLSRSIFDDHFRLNVQTYAVIFILLVFQYMSFFSKEIFPHSENLQRLISLVPKLFSFFFMLLGILEAIHNRKYDLIDARMRFRNTYIIVTSLVIGITLIVEIIGIRNTIPAILPVFQKGTIVALALSFIYFNFDLQPGFFLQVNKNNDMPKSQEHYPQIESKIAKLFDEEKIYRTEGLTITRLAEMMKEQEYRVRRTINGQLGFRNFNDFLNKYRIQEACTILEDPSKSGLTILEIAYSLGYQSIGPFNKAFKEQTGFTPTAYRKQKGR